MFTGGTNLSNKVELYEFNSSTSAWSSPTTVAVEEHISGVACNSAGDVVAWGNSAYNPGSAANTGHAQVVEWNGSAWTQKGQDLFGQAEKDYFAGNGAINLDGAGNTLIVGAQEFVDVGGGDASATSKGYAKIFTWNKHSSLWDLTRRITGYVTWNVLFEWPDKDNSMLGFSAVLSRIGDVAAVGGPYHDYYLQEDAGIVEVWKKNMGIVSKTPWLGGTGVSYWASVGSPLIGFPGDQLASSVSINNDATVIAIGIPYSNSTKGSAKVFLWNGSAWTQRGNDILGNENIGEHFGQVVSLNSSGTTVAISAPRASQYVPISTDVAGYIGIYDWNGSAWVVKGATFQSVYLQTSAQGGFDSYMFGQALKLNGAGDRIVVGSQGNDTNGAVEVYFWNSGNTTWEIKTGYGQALCGSCVGFDTAGDTVAIVYPADYTLEIESWNGTAWVQKGIPPGWAWTTPYHPDSFYYGGSEVLGESISLSGNGNVVAFGDLNGDNTNVYKGKVFVYEYDPGGSSPNYWTLKGSVIEGSVNGDRLGGTVNLNNDGTVLVTTSRHNSSGVGKTFLYNWNSTSSAWEIGKEFNDGVGAVSDPLTVALSNNTDSVIIGAPKYDAGPGFFDIVSNAGATNSERFGSSVALNNDGTRMIVGAGHYHGTYSGSPANSYTGRIKMYEWSANTWVEMATDPVGGISGTSLSSELGWSVDINSAGTIIIAGEENYDLLDALGNTVFSNCGRAVIYEWSGSAWVQKGSNIVGDSAADLLGRSVSINAAGDIVAVGIPYYDAAGQTDAGAVKVYEWDPSLNSGNGDWAQKGSTITDTTPSSNARFGRYVSISDAGTTVAIYTDGGQKTLVYEWDGATTAWVQKGAELVSPFSQDTGQHMHISGDGLTVAIGFCNNTDQKTVVYEWDSSLNSGTGDWAQKGDDLVAPNYPGFPTGSQKSGSSVSLSTDGNLIAIGERGSSGASISTNYTGSTSFYRWNTSAWVLEDQIIDSEQGTAFGWDVGLSGNGKVCSVSSIFYAHNGPTSSGGRVQSFAVGPGGVDAGKARVWKYIS